MSGGPELPAVASDIPGAIVSRRSEESLRSWETFLQVDERGDTPLHVAARNGNIVDVRNWISTATKNTTDGLMSPLFNNDGFTPLHYIVNHRGRDWQVALHELLSIFCGFCCMELGDKAGGDTPLHLAAMANNVDAVRTLVDAKQKFGEPLGQLALNARGMTALDIAVDSSETAIVFQILRILPSIDEQSAERYIRLPGFLNDLFRKIWGIVCDKEDYNGEASVLIQLLYDLSFPNGNSLSPDNWIKNSQWKRDSLLYLARMQEFDVNQVYGNLEQTALHIATMEIYRDVVKIILEDRNADLVDANREDIDGNCPLQFAVEEGLPGIQFLLMKRNEVRESVERLYRDRQVYVDAANAILVVAALIASVTFAGWLQPPLGYSGEGQYAAVAGHPNVRRFWIFNNLSFFFAIATVFAGAGAVLPNPNVYIGKAVSLLSFDMWQAVLMLQVSIVFVLVAFTSAGFAVLPPEARLDRSMVVPPVIGLFWNVLRGWQFVRKISYLRPSYRRRGRWKNFWRAWRSGSAEELEREIKIAIHHLKRESPALSWLYIWLLKSLSTTSPRIVAFWHGFTMGYDRRYKTSRAGIRAGAS